MKNISSGTIVRTIVLMLALVNQCLSATGHAVIPIEDEQIESFVTLGLTIASALAAWWKNNSFTRAALAGDALMKEMKEG